MNIVMMTNTYKPIVGGLERSIEICSDEYRARGHKVLIVAPEYKGAPEDELDTVRVPALQKFNNTDFSIELPIHFKLDKALDEFKPDIVHSHHPFLIGDTALRVASKRNIPLVFTNHTLYEKYTHYIPADSEVMQKFVIRLSRGYANLCDHVIAPSQSVKRLLIKRGVKTPISIVPTGIYIERFTNRDGRKFRGFYDIPEDAFLVGTIGRMAPEKNVIFLAESLAIFLKKNKHAFCAFIGSGPSLENMKKIFKRFGVSERLVAAGTLGGSQLASAYAALDVFAFASHSETQGLVLLESMASGTPVVAVDAPGVREIMRDYHNGRVIKRDNKNQFIAALQWVQKRSRKKNYSLPDAARQTAAEYTVARSIDASLEIYKALVKTKHKEHDLDDNPWRNTMRQIKTQSKIMENMSISAMQTAFEAPESALKRILNRIKRLFKKNKVSKNQSVDKATQTDGTPFPEVKQTPKKRIVYTKGELSRFFISGLIVVATDLGCYYLFSLMISHPLAKGISFLVGAVLSFLLNKYWTFKQSFFSRSEIVRYIVVNMLALALNMCANYMFLIITNYAVFISFVCTTFLTALFTFLTFKFWVFKKPS
jgi:1,2-diacylglycerol 3-alpha-glucosyltransferase